MLSVKYRIFKLYFTFSGGEKVPKRLSMGMVVFLMGMEIRCFLSVGIVFSDHLYFSSLINYTVPDINLVDISKTSSTYVRTYVRIL